MTITAWGSLSGVVGTDTVTLDTSSASASFADKTVGNGKTVTAAGLALGGADSGLLHAERAADRRRRTSRPWA